MIMELGTFGRWVNFSSPSIVLLGIVVVVLLLSYVVRRQRYAPLPPGPKGRYPLVGMTFDMPKVKPWVQLAEWAKYVATPR
jgi:hypothetical protein